MKNYYKKLTPLIKEGVINTRTSGEKTKYYTPEEYINNLIGKLYNTDEVLEFRKRDNVMIKIALISITAGKEKKTCGSYLDLEKEDRENITEILIQRAYQYLAEYGTETIELCIKYIICEKPSFKTALEIKGGILTLTKENIINKYSTLFPLHLPYGYYIKEDMRYLDNTIRLLEDTSEVGESEGREVKYEVKTRRGDTKIVKIVRNIDNYRITIGKIIFKVQYSDKLINIISKLESYKKENKPIPPYLRGEVYLIEAQYSPQPIKPLKESKKKGTKFGIIDIETYMEGEKMVPYACGYKTEDKEKVFYITEYITEQKMFDDLFRDICRSKYKGYTFYCHNLSGFDSVFLLNNLPNNIIGEILKDSNNRILSITLKFKSSLIRIFDSYQILPFSLKTISTSFGLKTKKGDFPYLFINKDTLNYTGETPNISYFKDISIEEYNKKNKTFDVKKETFVYLLKDLKSLFEAIEIYREFFYKNFKIDILKLPTLPSIAFSIFRTVYLQPNLSTTDRSFEVMRLTGNVARNIKTGYYGGRCEVFKPHGTELYHYDINSLYPYVMANFPIPVGNHKKIYSTNLEDYFGFVNCEVTVTDLKYPVLPVHFENKLIFPLGKFKGWYFSEELKLAKELGYKIEIKEGYTFEKGEIFKEYVKDMYHLKSDTNPLNKTVGKLLLNSLYGRFGLDVSKYMTTKIIPLNELPEYLDNYEIKDFISLPNKETAIISFIKDLSKGMLTCTILNNTIDFNTNVSIAAAISAYARITCYRLFSKIGFDKIYYTDTDSIFTSLDISTTYPELLGSNIGQLKQIGEKIKEGYFISSKLYGTVDIDGNCDIKSRAINSDLISYLDIKNIYNNQKVKVLTTKYIRDFYQGAIHNKTIDYTISTPTFDNREKHFDSTNTLWTDTYPLTIDLVK